MPILDEEHMHRAWNGDDDWNSDLPPDLKEFFVEQQLENSYNVQLKLFSNDSGTGRPRIVANFKNNLPDYDTIAATFGLGRFRHTFFWKDAAGKQKSRDFDFELSGPHYHSLFVAAQDEAKKVAKDKLENDYQERAISAKHLGMAQVAPADPAASGLAYAKGLMEVSNNMMAPVLALMKPNAGSSNGSSNDMMLPLITLMFNSQAENTKMMMNMMTMMNNQTTTLLTSMLGRNTHNSEEDVMEKAMNRMERILDLKNTLSPKEESTFDKVVKLLEGFSTAILGYVANKQSMTSQAMEPIIEQVKASDEVQIIRKSHALQVKICTKLDEDYGSRDANAIMTTLGFSRPSECPYVNDEESAAENETAPSPAPEAPEALEEVQG